MLYLNFNDSLVFTYKVNLFFLKKNIKIIFIKFVFHKIKIFVLILKRIIR